VNGIDAGCTVKRGSSRRNHAANIRLAFKDANWLGLRKSDRHR